MKFLYQSLIVAIFLLTLAVVPVRADECQNQCVDVKDQKDNLTCQATCLQNKINDSKNQQNSLAATIATFNQQIQVQQIQIDQTKAQIADLETQIQTLSGKLSDLELSLNSLSLALISKVQDNYKQEQLPQLSLLFFTDSLSSLVQHLEYVHKSQERLSELMKQAETARQNYDLEKSLKEEKQAEIEQKRKQLQAQQNQLNSQKQQKQQLLTLTQNDEKRYQSLLAQALAQLASFSGYAQSQGGAGLLSGQTKCDGWGCYYNQRDEQWGNMRLGNTNYTMATSGCLVTSVAMMASHYGKNIKPGDIAANSSVFTFVAFLKHDIIVNGIAIKIGYLSKGSLDSQLASGQSVVAGIRNDSHFIVVKRKEGGDYIVNDPYLENGSDHHTNLSDLSSLRSVSF